MQLLSDLYRTLYHQFLEAGFENPQGEVRAILAPYFGHLRLIVDQNYRVPPSWFKELWHYSQERLARKPVSRLLGYREFWGLVFSLNSDTLDPRPDTETMIEQIIQLYPGNGQKLRILDIGTGSGCILLALLSCFLFSVGVGVDCSKNAVSMARTNALALALHRRSDFFCLDWNVDSMEHLGRFDLIASNPPYIPESCINTLDPEVAYWDPNVALNGGKDGLGAYRVLLPICMALMKKEGILALEIGKSQAAQVIHLAKTIGLSYVNSGYDLQKIERIVVFQLN